jgi:hypothetical protein
LISRLIPLILNSDQALALEEFLEALRDSGLAAILPLHSWRAGSEMVLYETQRSCGLDD